MKARKFLALGALSLALGCASAKAGGAGPAQAPVKTPRSSPSLETPPPPELPEGVTLPPKPSADSIEQNSETDDGNPGMSPGQAALYQAFSPKDDSPPCVETDALSETPAEDMLWLINNVSMPPWVGTRAARCVVQTHATEPAARAAIDEWLSKSMFRGFAYLTIGELDTIAATNMALALELAQFGLAHFPDREAIEKRLRRSKVPELKALAPDN